MNMTGQAACRDEKRARNENGSRRAEQFAEPALFLLFLAFRCGADDGAELLEEITGELFRRRINEAAAELGEFAADLGVDGVVANFDQRFHPPVMV